MFQSYALFPNLTAAKNVAYGLENARMPRAEIRSRVRELLELVGLADQGDKYPAQLSGGQQQRVALARALATSPGLLLLDEPLSALDAKVRVHLRHEIRQLQRRLGVTTIMVTHDQEEALTMADRIVVMNRGVIEQVGTPLEVYRRPASAFVADFIGVMNFVPAVVVRPGTVRLGALELACDVDGLPAGTGLTLAIRPEDIRVQSVTGSEENALTVHIEAIEFLGSFFRVDLAGEALDGVTLRADLAVDLVRRLDLAEGQSPAGRAAPEAAPRLPGRPRRQLRLSAAAREIMAPGDGPEAALYRGHPSAGTIVRTVPAGPRPAGGAKGGRSA